MQYAKTTLENVHDGVVDALPVIDDLVVVDACNDEDRTVIGTGLFNTLLGGFFRIPSTLSCCVLLGLSYETQELNMAGGKEVPATIDIDDCLTGSHALALNEMEELSLLFFDSLVGV